MKLKAPQHSSSAVLIRLGLGSLMALAMACGATESPPPVDTAIPDTATSEQPLYGLGSLASRWPSGYVPVCFTDYSSGDARQEKIRWILTDTWGAVAGIKFTGFGPCLYESGNAAVWVRFSSERSSVNHLGYGLVSMKLPPIDDTFLASTAGSNTGNSLSRFRATVLHEFGHALGFKHEQQRPDNWTYNPDGSPNESKDCGAPDDRTSDEWDQWKPVSGGIYFGNYDHNSVMGYCSREPGTTSGRVQNLSASDIAGVRSSTAYGPNPFRPRSVRNILWRSSSTGDIVQWHMNGKLAVNAYPVTATVGRITDTNWQIKGSGDFDGDGVGDILWRKSDGQLAIWHLNSGSLRTPSFPGAPGNDWQIHGIGDFDKDGYSDILWRNIDGTLAIWGRGTLNRAWYPGRPGNDWVIRGVGDFDADGYSDILWRNNDGTLAVWGRGDLNRAWYPGKVGNEWAIGGVGDFDGDKYSDILWRKNDGALAIWGRASLSRATYPGGVGNDWLIEGIGDFDTDGRSDILWRNTNGQVAIWWKGAYSGASYPGVSNNNDWQIQATMLDLNY